MIIYVKIITYNIFLHYLQFFILSTHFRISFLTILKFRSLKTSKLFLYFLQIFFFFSIFLIFLFYLFFSLSLSSSFVPCQASDSHFLTLYCIYIFFFLPLYLKVVCVYMNFCVRLFFFFIIEVKMHLRGWKKIT